MTPIPEGAQFFCQDEREFNPLLGMIKGSSSMLEIGSRYGASLKVFAANMAEGSKLVTVDLGRCPDVTEHETGLWWREICDELSKKHEVHRIQGDSHSAEIIKQVRDLGPYDFIFIDGDHSSEGVRADWENFGDLGKYVAFHDIALSDVFPLWAEIQRKRRTVHFVHTYGIGVVLP